MADINITITIPDAWVTRVQEALTGQAEKRIELHFDNAHINYTYPVRGADNWLVYAKKVFTEHLKQQIKVYELSLDYERYSTDINLITQPFEDVPDGIIT